ncbi:hypothetical protein DPMN_137201 [Dreissena polymorpha]|uniref:Uncharacterized protein n=1 Tax=Dreissena polymorpha TaxID=45954 RepID=A0A9D4G2C4_DREPO|nr:hypothetical protein DPMN_137201 [Dreissena polymorpha]
MNILTKFHEDRKINVASRVHVFQANITIFKPIQDINETNILTKFHEDWTINVASRVFTTKNAPPFGSHVFQANTKLLTKFHEEWTINVASRVKTPPPLGGHVFSLIWTIFELVQNINKTNANILTSKVFTRKTAPPLAAIFELSRDQTINVASRVFTRQNVDDIQRTTDKRQSQKLTMSMLHSDIIYIQLLTKFGEDRMKYRDRPTNVTPI